MRIKPKDISSMEAKVWQRPSLTWTYKITVKRRFWWGRRRVFPCGEHWEPLIFPGRYEAVRHAQEKMGFLTSVADLDPPYTVKPEA